MLDFFEYAEMLLDTLLDVGDWLLTPRYLADLTGGSEDLLLAWLNAAGFTEAYEFLYSWNYTPYSFAAVLFGGGITLFLILRLLKTFNIFS